jgi:hypothetical protein
MIFRHILIIFTKFIPLFNLHCNKNTRRQTTKHAANVKSVYMLKCICVCMCEYKNRGSTATDSPSTNNWNFPRFFKKKNLFHRLHNIYGFIGLITDTEGYPTYYIHKKICFPRYKFRYIQGNTYWFKWLIWLKSHAISNYFM